MDLKKLGFNDYVELALAVMALLFTGVLIGVLLLLLTAIAEASPSPAGCSTDTECAEMFGGNGDPEPAVEIEGFLFCPEPAINKPVILRSGALMKFS